jgi:tetratricopeptide (TPR) repeat protein
MSCSAVVLVLVASLQLSMAREAERGNYDAALAHAERVRDILPGHLAVAQVQLRFARWHEGADSAETASRVTTVADPARRIYCQGLRSYALGMSAAQHGRIEEAALRQREVEAALLLLTGAGDGGGLLRLLRVKARELEGFAASARGEHDRALTVLRNAAAMEAGATTPDPSHYTRPVLETLADAAIRAGRLEDARQAYEAVLHLRPDSYHALRGLQRVNSRR